jgi:uncharacterized protein YhjY with autotransporter beta-barrel domain
MRHRLGWQAAWEQAHSWGRAVPYVRLTHEKEYKEGQGSLTAGFVGSPFAFSTPVRNQTDGYGLLAMGATLHYGRLAAHVGLSTTVGRDGGRDRSLSLGLSLPF